MTLSTIGITYGSGDYEVFYSSVSTTRKTQEGDKLFDRNETRVDPNVGGVFQASQYNATSGAYIGTRYLV